MDVLLFPVLADSGIPAGALMVHLGPPRHAPDKAIVVTSARCTWFHPFAKSLRRTGAKTWAGRRQCAGCHERSGRVHALDKGGFALMIPTDADCISKDNVHSHQPRWLAFPHDDGATACIVTNPIYRFRDLRSSLNCRSPLAASQALLQNSALARSLASTDLFMRVKAKFIRVNV